MARLAKALNIKAPSLYRHVANKVELLREVNRAYQHACRSAIERFDGYVARYMGDGVLAYFGYPQAHEDDPEREVCLVDQLAVLASPPTVPVGEGWFYDDFSTATDACTFESQQRVTFVDGSGPEPGTSVRFECLQGIIPDEPASLA